MKLFKRPFSKKMVGALLAGIGIALCTLAMSRLDHFTIQGMRYLGLFLVAFALYLLAVICLYYRLEPSSKSILCSGLRSGQVSPRYPLMFGGIFGMDI